MRQMRSHDGHQTLNSVVGAGVFLPWQEFGQRLGQLLDLYLGQCVNRIINAGPIVCLAGVNKRLFAQNTYA